MFGELKRLTDLFVEGEVLDLGDDSEGKPALIWVNKPNDFESDEARRDGAAARSDRLMELQGEDSQDAKRIRTEMVGKDQDGLVNLMLQYRTNEILGTALNRAKSDESERQYLEYLARQEELLNDADVPADDPRRQRLESKEAQFVGVFQHCLEAVKQEQRNELRGLKRDEIEDKLLQAWRDQESMDTFMLGRRWTLIYYAMRMCRATRKDEGGYDHAACNHFDRVLSARSEVKLLPDGLQKKVNEALDRLEVGVVEAGNLDVPVTSSALSEPLSEEAASTPSTPEVTPPVAAAT